MGLVLASNSSSNGEVNGGLGNVKSCRSSLVIEPKVVPEAFRRSKMVLK